MCLYPGWSARENYARHKKRAGKKHEARKKSPDPDADQDSRCVVEYNEGEIFIALHGDDDDECAQGLRVGWEYWLLSVLVSCD